MRPTVFLGLRNRFAQTLDRFWAGNTRLCSSSQPNKSDDIKKILSSRFPNAERIEVADVSGGCGAMFEVYVKDAEFKGLNTVKQHRIVTATLQEEIKNMHGIRIHTEVVKA